MREGGDVKDGERGKGWRKDGKKRGGLTERLREARREVRWKEG